jgi:DNA repair protein RadC
LLEILLFYSIPQKNTNEIAHELLRNHGSFSSLLNSDSKEIEKAFFVKESSSALIMALGEINRRKADNDKKYSFGNGYEDCTQSVLEAMKGISQNGLYVLWIDCKGGLLLPFCIQNEKTFFEENLLYCRNVFNVGIGGAVVVSVAYDSLLFPKNLDFERVKAFENRLGNCHIPLFEYYLYNGKNIVGIRGKEKYDSAFHSDADKNRNQQLL